MDAVLVGLKSPSLVFSVRIASGYDKRKTRSGKGPRGRTPGGVVPLWAVSTVRELDRLMMAQDDLMNGSPSNVADIAVGQAETPHQIWSTFSEEQKGLANRILNKLPRQGVLSSHSDLLDNEYKFMLKHKTFWAGDMSDLSGLESELQKLGYFTIDIRSRITEQIKRGECRIFFVDESLTKTPSAPDG
jgi:hypothetical protein